MPETVTYPEHEKLAKVRDRSQTIGEFLDWAGEQGWHLCEWVPADPTDWGREEELAYVRLTVDQKLALYFDIDLVVLEEEKRRMLDEIRNG